MQQTKRKLLAAIRDTKVTTLAEFVQAVETITQIWNHNDEWIDPWFRGQNNADHKLVPGLYRLPKRTALDNPVSFDESDWQIDFKLRAFPLLAQHGFLRNFPPQSEFDWYCLMQHYELPTRLLDWSEGALIALHFALARPSSYREADGADLDAAVWMLDPYALNRSTIHVDGIAYADDAYAARRLPDPFTGTLRAARPIAIQAPLKSPRIAAQRGIFTLHGSKPRPIDDFVDRDRCLRIVVEGGACPDLRRQLRLMGVTESAIFPELPGLARELRQVWIDEVKLLADIDDGEPLAPARGRLRSVAAGRSRRAPRSTRRTR